MSYNKNSRVKASSSDINKLLHVGSQSPKPSIRLGDTQVALSKHRKIKDLLTILIPQHPLLTIINVVSSLLHLQRHC